MGSTRNSGCWLITPTISCRLAASPSWARATEEVAANRAATATALTILILQTSGSVEEVGVVGKSQGGVDSPVYTGTYPHLQTGIYPRLPHPWTARLWDALDAAKRKNSFQSRKTTLCHKKNNEYE